jgi:dGTPase
LLGMAQLDEVPLFAAHRAAALAEHPPLRDLPERRLLAETLRRLLSAQVADVISATRAHLHLHAPEDAQAVRVLPPLVQFTPPMREQVTALKRFLFAALYRHPQVAQTTARARDVVRVLFAAYADAPQQLPDEHRLAHEQIGLRAVADYIAGMTDRFASREYTRLTGRAAFESG